MATFLPRDLRMVRRVVRNSEFSMVIVVIHATEILPSHKSVCVL